MTNNKYFSTKKFPAISTGHRQWRDKGSHCSYVHGYGRIVKFTFGATELDHRGWVVDFGDLKDVKKWLEEQWDHRVLIAHDDPLLDELKTLHELGGININIMPEEYGPGIELSCKYVYDHVNKIIKQKTNGRCWVQIVEVWEHEGNSAKYGTFPT